jgi:hypothetical protein
LDNLEFTILTTSPARIDTVNVKVIDEKKWNSKKNNYIRALIYHI